MPFPLLLSLFLLFVISIHVGSFLNVLIDRIPKGEGFVKGRSYCDHCKKRLRAFDLVPLFSFIFLRGKCRYCGQRISLYYPLVELLTALLFLLAIYSLPTAANQLFVMSHLPSTLYYLFIVSCLITIFFTDLKYGIIPDKIVYPAILISFLFLILNSKFLILNYLLSGLGAGLFFLILHVATRGKGMGAGDVKLAFLMGFLLGAPLVIISLYLAFLTGAAVSLILILWRKKTRKDTISFGPFLTLGTYASLFWGKEILQIVSKILGLPL